MSDTDLDFKAVIGFLPSHGINLIMKSGVSHKKKIALVNFINSFPNWFRSVDRKIKTQTNFGFQIWCDRWDIIGQTIIASGQWEGLLSRTIIASLKQGDIAIDIGANMGYDTMLMSTAVGSEGTVLAFEPDLKNLAALLSNIALLEHSNVAVQSLALSDQPTLTRISMADDDNRGISNLRPGGTGLSHPIFATRLDKLLENDNFSRIQFVKMDIEGFEFKAIVGIGLLIDRIDCLACEINPSFLQQCGSSAEDVFTYMKNHGFSCFCAEPSSNTTWKESDHNYKISAEHSNHFDALFCRNISDKLGALIERAP